MFIRYVVPDTPGQQHSLLAGLDVNPLEGWDPAKVGHNNGQLCSRLEGSILNLLGGLGEGWPRSDLCHIRSEAPAPIFHTTGEPPNLKVAWMKLSTLRDKNFRRKSSDWFAESLGN